MVRTFMIQGNHVTVCPPIPDNVTRLIITRTRLTALPNLPNGLEILWCSYNQLTSLPSLPSGLTEFWSFGNQLTSLPDLPSGLKILWCQFNQLTSLSTLPIRLTWTLIITVTQLYGIKDDPIYINIPDTERSRYVVEKSGQVIWVGNDIDKEIWSMYPPKWI